MNITIIGAGNMGGAIARGISKIINDKRCAQTLGFSSKIGITVSNRNLSKLEILKSEHPQINVTTDNLQAVKDADIVILAIKPWVLPLVLDEIRENLNTRKCAIVSIVGGVSLDDLEIMLDNIDFETYHVIPTTAIAIGKSMTFVSSRRAQNDTMDFICSIFGSLGEVAIIEERLMPAATALSSCGIAYVYKYVQASVQAGVQMGFYPKDAQRYVEATIDGAIAMLRENKTLPQTEIDRVTTPGGLTIKGINMLDHCGFSSAVIKATLAPIER